MEAVHNGTAVATEHEVMLVNGQFQQLASLLDLLFHFLNMDIDEVNAYNGNFKEDVSTNLDKLLWLWIFYFYLLLVPSFI